MRTAFCRVIIKYIDYYKRGHLSPIILPSRAEVRRVRVLLAAGAGQCIQSIINAGISARLYYLARRRYGACAFCPPQVRVNVSEYYKRGHLSPIILPGWAEVRRVRVLLAAGAGQCIQSTINAGISARSYYLAGRRNDACAFCPPQVEGGILKNGLCVL